MDNHKIYSMAFGVVYPLYLKKVVRKGKTEEELITVITWLTGYTKQDIEIINKKNITLKEFFENAPLLNDNRALIKGVICGIRVEDIEHPLMKNIRYLDKLVDELANGKKMERILRK